MTLLADTHTKLNNNVKFLLKSVFEVTTDEIADIKKKVNQDSYFLFSRMCSMSTFSNYRRGIKSFTDKRWKLLREFKRLVEGVEPELVTMENVPRLKEERIFKEFVKSLNSLKYYTSYSVVNCADYGVPQHRNRLVLMASKLGNVELIRPTHTPSQYTTVRDVLKNLPKIKAGTT